MVGLALYLPLAMQCRSNGINLYFRHFNKFHLFIYAQFTKAEEFYTGIQSSEHNKHFQLLLLKSRPLTSESVPSDQQFKNKEGKSKDKSREFVIEHAGCVNSAEFEYN